MLEAPSPKSHRQDVIAPWEVSRNRTWSGALPLETSREKAATGGGVGFTVGVGVGVRVGAGVGVRDAVSVGVGSVVEPEVAPGVGVGVGDEVGAGSPPLVHAAKASTPRVRVISHFDPGTLNMPGVYMHPRFVTSA